MTVALICGLAIGLFVLLCCVVAFAVAADAHNDAAFATQTGLPMGPVITSSGAHGDGPYTGVYRHRRLFSSNGIIWYNVADGTRFDTAGAFIPAIRLEKHRKGAL